MVMDGLNFHPDDQKSALDAWQNAIANNTAYSLNAECVKKMVLILVVSSSSALFR
jgi:hypothetical protein